MSLIQPKQQRKRKQIRVNIDSQVADEIGQYCLYAGFQRTDEFIEEAALLVLTRDKAFKEWKTVSLSKVENLNK